jgi:hypothetical protein
MPPLHPVDPKEVYCAEKTELVLPAEGAPLVFATAYAHDMVLRLKGKNGKFVDLPVKADAEKGGFVADTAGLGPSNFGDVLDGSLHGYWGFDSYNGPEFRLENTHPQHWQLADEDQQALIAGHDDLVHIETENAACVDSIQLEKPTGETVKADWKSTGPNQVAVTLPLKKVKPGTLKLLVKQYGSKDPDIVPLQAFAQAGHFDSFTLHAGDLSGVLKGNRLDEVKELVLNGISFKPEKHAAAADTDELSLVTADVKAAVDLKEGYDATAKVALKDGRVLSLETTVAAPRPKVTLIGKSVQPSASATASNIQLADQDELPQNAQLTFSIHAQVPAAFSGDEKVEVATVQGAYLATLTSANGLTLEDSQVALATLDTAKAFASSASGPLRFRVIEKGTASDWQPLATLVRLPAFGDLQCSDTSDEPCKLTGAKLFLVDSISNDPQFNQSTSVPEGFPGNTLTVPHPTAGHLYVKLHDDPSIVNPVLFPAEALSHPIALTNTSPVSTSANTPSTAGDVTPAAPATKQAASATASPTPSPATNQPPQSGAGATTSPGLSGTASQQGKSPTPQQPAPKDAPATSGTPAASDSTASPPSNEPK